MGGIVGALSWKCRAREGLQWGVCIHERECSACVVREKMGGSRIKAWLRTLGDGESFKCKIFTPLLLNLGKRLFEGCERVAEAMGGQMPSFAAISVIHG